jgi:hypothetical protein
MTKLMNYRVLRPHDGDRFYREGETRTAKDTDVKHLIPNVLEEIGPADFGGKGDHDGDGKTGGTAPAVEVVLAPVAEKAETEPLNKAESAAPANKAASSRKSKRK